MSEIESWLDIDPAAEGEQSDTAQPNVSAEADQEQDDGLTAVDIKGQDAVNAEASAMLKVIQQPAGADGQPQTETKAPPADAAEPDPEGIATADGKRIIPFDVLKSARNEAKEAKARADQFERQLQAQLQLNQQAAGQQPSAQALESDGQADMTASEWEAVLKQAKEDGDDLLQKAAEGALADRERLNGLERRLQEREQREQQLQEQQQHAALNDARTAAQRHPDIAVWMEDARMSAMVQEVERIAGQVPGSAVANAQTWDDYWSAVAETAAVMHPTLPRTKEAPTTGRATAEAGKAASPDGDSPVSMSGMAGGVSPGSGEPGDAGELAGLPRGDQVAALNKLRESGKIFDFLDGAPVGALNATGG